MMERKSGHTPEEAKRILEEAAQRKQEAEREQADEMSNEDLSKIVKELGPDALKERKDDLDRALNE